MLARSTPHAVIQPKPGIGDVIWHLPFIRAIAAVSPGGQVTFLAPPTSGARELLAAEPAVAETIYFNHSGSELQRGVNLIRLVALLRLYHFQKIWILDRTIRPALAALLAGIPERIGVGLTAQRRFITNSGISQSHFHDHPIGWLHELMSNMGVPMPESQRDLLVSAEALREIDTNFGHCERPWIVLGIGASHPVRDWSNSYWAEFIARLRQQTSGTLFLIGGNANMARAQSFVDDSVGAPAVNACGLPLGRSLALLQRADLFVGTDSGPMNMAVAVGTPAFAMFGVNPVLTYSKYIHPIVPDGGPAPDGMMRISPAQVLEQALPYLSRRKQPA
jgi:heptosyltransferase-2